MKLINSRQTMTYKNLAKIYLESMPYFHFRLGEWNNEEEHLLKKNVAQNKSLVNEKLGRGIILQFNIGKSIMEIASLTGVSKSTVHLYKIKNI